MEACAPPRPIWWGKTRSKRAAVRLTQCRGNCNALKLKQEKTKQDTNTAVKVPLVVPIGRCNIKKPSAREPAHLLRAFSSIVFSGRWLVVWFDSFVSSRRSSKVHGRGGAQNVAGPSEVVRHGEDPARLVGSRVRPTCTHRGSQVHVSVGVVHVGCCVRLADGRRAAARRRRAVCAGVSNWWTVWDVGLLHSLR